MVARIIYARAAEVVDSRPTVHIRRDFIRAGWVVVHIRAHQLDRPGPGRNARWVQQAGEGRNGLLGLSGLSGLSDLLHTAADLVLPRPCPGCGRAGPWCDPCAATLAGPPRRVRPPDHLTDADRIPPIWALARYAGPVRAAILAGKEKGRRDLPGILGSPLGEAVRQLHAWGAVDEPVWLVPAPSRRSAARRRGGDPVRIMATVAAQVAAGAGLATGVAPCLVTVGRSRDSVGLDAVQRQRNLAGRVCLIERAAPPPGAGVLLVDDVLTTGATAAASTRVLRSAGRPVVGMIVLAGVPGWVVTR